MLLIDTNIWLIAADEDSNRHGEIIGLLADHDWAAPTAVVAESAWFILDRLGTRAHQRFLDLVVAGQLEPIELTDADWRRCAELTATYADLALDLVDASLVAVAERLGHTTIFTLNARDFRVVRLAHCDGFELIPAPAT